MTETLNLKTSYVPTEGYRLNVANTTHSTSTQPELIQPTTNAEAPMVAPIAEATEVVQADVTAEPTPSPTAEEPAATIWEQRTPEDFARIKSEAQKYFEHFDGPEGIKRLQGEMSVYLLGVANEMTKQFKELGLLPEDDSDPEQTKNTLAKINEAVESAKAAKIAELCAVALPYETDKRRDKKQVNKLREKLTELLSAPPEQFTQLMKDWETYEIDQQHGEALQEDKSYKVGEQRKAARQEISSLDRKYGGALREVSRLPLDLEAGGNARGVIDLYLQKEQKIKDIKDPLANKEVLQKGILEQALSDLNSSLRQKYEAEGLTDEQIRAKLAEASPHLETWLKHIDARSNPIADLERYNNQGNKEKMLSQRRKRAGEYIGSMLLIQGIRGAYERGGNSEREASIDVRKILERGIDHNGSRLRTAVDVLGNPDRAGSLGGRIMSELETARNLSRNESTLMRSLIYMTAVERSLGDSFITAWDKIPEEKKREARKKLMLGMASASGTIRRLSARLAAKTRKTAATGAAAGTIWLGNKLNKG